MDLNDEYLRMILALQDEFFEGWEWKEGDRFILINRKKGKIVDYQDGTIGDSVLENGEVGYIWTSGYSGEYGFEKYDSEIKPIPSQEQLLKISKLDWDLYYYDLLKRYSDYDTAEQAGLAMIMYTKYAKKWDGEAWI